MNEENNKFFQNLLDIHYKMEAIEKFIKIRNRANSLKLDDPNYLKLVEYSDLILKVMTAFEKYDA